MSCVAESSSETSVASISGIGSFGGFVLSTLESTEDSARAFVVAFSLTFPDALAAGPAGNLLDAIGGFGGAKARSKD